VELYFHSPNNTPSWRGAQLKHRDNFTLILQHNVNKVAITFTGTEYYSFIKPAIFLILATKLLVSWREAEW
jgi:hypothetical protein